MTIRGKILRAASAAAVVGALAMPASAPAQEIDFNISGCLTPVVPCALERVDRLYDAVKDLADDPPPLNYVCELVWGQPCAYMLP